jgi:tetratricopeptide (TPR) repeat protein
MGLLAFPAAILAWVPTAASLTPDRWALFYVKMFTAYENAGRLDAALDAMDDGRALDPRLASYFQSSLNSFVARDQRLRLTDDVSRLAIAERGSRRDGSPLRLARWLRLLPDGSGREESRRLLEDALEKDPDDPRVHRELGAWWLDAAGDPEARRHARDELDRASRGDRGDPSAAILFALISGDPRQLDRPALRRLDRNSPRLRMARASLAAHRRSSIP